MICKREYVAVYDLTPSIKGKKNTWIIIYNKTLFGIPIGSGERILNIRGKVKRFSTQEKANNYIENIKNFK